MTGDWRPGTVYKPALLVTTEFTVLVARCVIVTLAPSTMLSAGSVTVPKIVAPPLCAPATAETNTPISSMRRMRVLMALVITFLPLQTWHVNEGIPGFAEVSI